jgi:hypothetical protein
MKQKLTRLLRALIEDTRGVAEYGMTVTVLIGLVAGLAALGGNLNDCIQSVGSLLRGLTGH